MNEHLRVERLKVACDGLRGRVRSLLARDGHVHIIERRNAIAELEAEHAAIDEALNALIRKEVLH